MTDVVSSTEKEGEKVNINTNKDDVNVNVNYDDIKKNFNTEKVKNVYNDKEEMIDSFHTEPLEHATHVVESYIDMLVCKVMRDDEKMFVKKIYIIEITKKIHQEKKMLSNSDVESIIDLDKIRVNCEQLENYILKNDELKEDAEIKLALFAIKTDLSKLNSQRVETTKEKEEYKDTCKNDNNKPSSSSPVVAVITTDRDKKNFISIVNENKDKISSTPLKSSQVEDVTTEVQKKEKENEEKTRFSFLNEMKRAKDEEMCWKREILIKGLGYINKNTILDSNLIHVIGIKEWDEKIKTKIIPHFNISDRFFVTYDPLSGGFERFGKDMKQRFPQMSDNQLIECAKYLESCNKIQQVFCHIPPGHFPDLTGKNVDNAVLHESFDPKKLYAEESSEFKWINKCINKFKGKRIYCCTFNFIDNTTDERKMSRFIESFTMYLYDNYIMPHSKLVKKIVFTSFIIPELKQIYYPGNKNEKCGIFLYYFDFDEKVIEEIRQKQMQQQQQQQQQQKDSINETKNQ